VNAMTHPRDSHPDSDQVHRAQASAPDRQAPSNAHPGDFIGRANEGPVDHSRLQVFDLPKQFLDWVHRKAPPPEGPRGRGRGSPAAGSGVAAVRPNAPERLPDATRPSTPERAPGRGAVSRASPSSPRPPSPPPSSPRPPFSSLPPTPPPLPRASRIPRRVAKPAQVGSRRAWALLSSVDHWARAHGTPRRVQVVAAAIGAGVLILLSWRHLDSGRGTPFGSGDGGFAPVPSAAAQAVTMGAGDEGATPGAAVSVAQAVTGAPGVPVTSGVPGFAVPSSVPALPAQSGITSAPRALAPGEDEAIVDMDESEPPGAVENPAPSDRALPVLHPALENHDFTEGSTKKWAQGSHPSSRLAEASVGSAPGSASASGKRPRKTFLVQAK